MRDNSEADFSVKVNLKMRSGKDCWDRLTLTISEGNTVHLYPFRNRNTCLDLYRQLYIYHCDGVRGPVPVVIDAHRYCWCEAVRKAVLWAADQWYEEYMSLVEL